MLNLGNQTLGRGKVYFSSFLPGTHTPAGERYVGNSPALSLTISQDKLDHFSSDGGVRVKDKSIILQVDYSGTLTLDDINIDNLALFFFGTKSTLAQTSATSQTQTFTNVIQGYGYALGQSGGVPTGVRNVTNVVVTVSSATKTLGTDYTVDAARGIIYPVEGGGIADASTMVVVYDRAAVSRTQVISGTTQLEGAMRYIATNPQGILMDYWFPYVRLGPNGDFALKSDEWQQLPLTVEILADTTTTPNKAAIYIDGMAA